MDSVSQEPTSVTISTISLRDAAVIGALTAGVLLIEHLALWRKPFRLSRPAAYAVGTVTLGAGFSAWAVRHRRYQALLAWWIIASMGGTVVALAYWIRSILQAIDAQALRAGQIAGRNGGYKQTAAPRD